MKTDFAAGRLKQLRGQMRVRWGRMTKDDDVRIAGRRLQFIGVLQERYGVRPEDAEKAFEALRRIDASGRSAETASTETEDAPEPGRVSPS